MSGHGGCLRGDYSLAAAAAAAASVSAEGCAAVGPESAPASASDSVFMRLGSGCPPPDGDSLSPFCRLVGREAEADA